MRKKTSSKGANAERMERMESENKPTPVMIPKNALSLQKWMMGRELEGGLARTPIIQRSSDRGGKEKAHLVERLRYQPLPSGANS